MDPGFTFLLLVAVACILGIISAFTRKSALQKWSLGALGVVTTLNLLQALAISWTFRDGMGPDAITSTGKEAFHRAFSDFWFPLLLIGIPVVFALAVPRFRSRGKQA